MFNVEFTLNPNKDNTAIVHTVKRVTLKGVEKSFDLRQVHKTLPEKTKLLGDIVFELVCEGKVLGLLHGVYEVHSDQIMANEWQEGATWG